MRYFWICGVDLEQKDILDILNIFIIAKAYNTKVEVCNFDLHSYHTTPIEQVDKYALIAIWKEISIKYMVQSRHDELKETIASITQLVSGERQERLNYIMYWVAILSAIAAIFSAIPICKDLIAWIASKI